MTNLGPLNLTESMVDSGAGMKACQDFARRWARNSALKRGFLKQIGRQPFHMRRVKPPLTGHPSPQALNTEEFFYSGVLLFMRFC